MLLVVEAPEELKERIKLVDDGIESVVSLLDFKRRGHTPSGFNALTVLATKRLLATSNQGRSLVDDGLLGTPFWCIRRLSYLLMNRKKMTRQMENA
ncbi:MAG: hypothetical protein KDA84_21265 [Planctomycetaceae bacterium]|nr:hypothetical protein [Planctomycetaceae bacterium]